MESLYKFIENHKKEDRTRSSFSNLVKKIKLESELFYFIENYLEFGTFKQKLYHIINKLPKSKIICDVCNERYLNWVENSNTYRTTCSIKCAGKLTGKKNKPKRESHPKLSKKEEFKEYFKLNKIKLTESNIKKVYPELFNEIKNEIYAEVAGLSDSKSEEQGAGNKKEVATYATLGLPEFLMFFGFLGLFLFMTFNSLSGKELEVTEDPFLKESLNHHI